MGKIYQRESLQRSGAPRKKKDEHNRKRSEIVNFRMSPEERKILDQRIKLSGLQKQDYMIQSSLNQKIVTFGNVKVFDEMKKQLFEIERQLGTVKKADDLDLEKLASLRMITEMIAGLHHE